MFKKTALLTALAALTFAGSASAALVNVNFHADAGGVTESELDGPLGGASSTWNQSSAFTGTDLDDSIGGGTTIDYSYSPGSIKENDTFSWADPDRVMQIGSFAQFGKGVDTTLTISGLTPGGLYDVAIASTRLRTTGTEHSHGILSTTNATTSAAAQTVDGLTSIDGDNWVLGTNYALFENVVADGGGEIAFLVDATDADELFGGSPAYRMHVNGFQIEEVPEPSSLALLGLGGLAVARRRRG